MKTAKYYFIAPLATVSPDCPLQLWCTFLPQVELTLNLLRTSHQNVSISAWEDLNGPFDYNRTPVRLIGAPAVVYKDPSKRGTWALHGTDAYYVGPAMEHYRHKKIWVPTTQRFSSTGSQSIYPAHCNVPTISEANQTRIAAGELLKAIRQAMPTQ